MKTKEEIQQRVKHIETDNIQNEDRKQYYTEQKDSDKIEMYKRMIKENNNKLEMLYWVLNQE